MAGGNAKLISALRLIGCLCVIGGVVLGLVAASEADNIIAFIFPFLAGLIGGVLPFWAAQHLDNQVEILKRLTEMNDCQERILNNVRDLNKENIEDEEDNVTQM